MLLKKILHKSSFYDIVAYTNWLFRGQHIFFRLCVSSLYYIFIHFVFKHIREGARQRDVHAANIYTIGRYSGTLLLWSPSGLGQSNLNRQVIVLEGLFGTAQDDHNGVVALLPSRQ